MQDYFLSRNKIKFRHSFVSAQVFGLPSSTGPLGFPNKVCDRLVKPAAVEMARIMCGEAVANKLAMVPLSDNTIKRRIEELSVDILQQIIGAVKQSEKFSLQLDETTDIGNYA